MIQLISCRTGSWALQSSWMSSLPTYQHVEIHKQETELVPHGNYYICAVDLFANGNSGLFHTVSQLLCANGIRVYTVIRASCMCADLHPSHSLQHCCARNIDSPQPVTHSDFAWVDIKKPHRAPSNHYTMVTPIILLILCHLVVLAYLLMPVSAEKLTGPHCVPSLNTFCLVVQQMPEHLNGGDPTDSTYLLPALLPLSLAIRAVSACLLSSSLVTSSSSTAPCTPTIMTRNFLCSLNRCGDYPKVGFSPTPGLQHMPRNQCF